MNRKLYLVTQAVITTVPFQFEASYIWKTFRLVL